MHKIDGSGHVNGSFVAEDAAAQTPGTVVTPAWLNAVQDELNNIVLDGSEPLDKNDNGQVLRHIKRLIAGVDADITAHKGEANPHAQYMTEAETRALIDRVDITARFTTTGSVSGQGLGVQAGGDWPVPLTAGDIILVKNNGGGSSHIHNGWYVASANNWNRVSNLDEVKPSNLTKVSEGRTLADTIWMLTTDAPITVGSTALAFSEKSDSFEAAFTTDFAGTGSNKIPDVATIIAGLLGTGSFTQSGYVSFPFRRLETGEMENVIFQFGSSTASVSNNYVANALINFPITFPVVPVYFNATLDHAVGPWFMYMGHQNLTQSGVIGKFVDAGINRHTFSNRPFKWFAIGFQEAP